LAQIQPVRIGLVGYGKGGRFFHAPMIAAAAGCELAGVVTRSAERRGDLERNHPGTPAAYLGCRRLLTWPGAASTIAGCAGTTGLLRLASSA
jgi:predicted dehydrogenase